MLCITETMKTYMDNSSLVKLEFSFQKKPNPTKTTTTTTVNLNQKKREGEVREVFLSGKDHSIF